MESEKEKIDERSNLSFRFWKKFEKSILYSWFEQNSSNADRIQFTLFPKNPKVIPPIGCNRIIFK